MAPLLRRSLLTAFASLALVDSAAAAAAAAAAATATSTSDAGKEAAAAGGENENEVPERDDAILPNVDTVGVVGTKEAEGSFAFGPTSSAETEGVQVSVKGASLAKMMEELLTNRRVMGNITIVQEPTGIIQGGLLTDLVIRKAVVEETKMSGDEDQVSLKVPALECSLTAAYNVKFTTLEIPAEGILSMDLGGGGFILNLPSGGAGEGSCRFDSGLKLRIYSASDLDSQAHPDSEVQNGLKSLMAAINSNILSLQDTMLHTVERTLCTTLLSGLAGDSNQASITVSKGNAPKVPAWEAPLAELGITPFDFALGLGLGLTVCCLGFSFCMCCWICCRRRPSPARTPETLPLKSTDEDEDSYNCVGAGPGGKKRGVLNSLTCCRRKPSNTVASMNMSMA